MQAAPSIEGANGEARYGNEEESDSDDGMHRDCKDPDESERRHFLDVCWSFIGYQDDALWEVARLHRAFSSLSPQDLALWPSSSSIDAWHKEIISRIQVNSDFLKQLPVPDVCGAYLGPNGRRMVVEVPRGHRVASRNSSKVRSTLRQFVRDWAADGASERANSYAPLIEALERHLPPPKLVNGNYPSDGSAPRWSVLCPGCGLGRLPFDLACRGYAAQGNEFSYQMLLGSHLILNRAQGKESMVIYPYILSTSNRKKSDDHLRAVKIPDVSEDDMPGNCMLSMAAGEFVEVYKDQEKEWDAVLTPFFIDTAKNIFIYIRTIAMLIKPKGCWVNLGPLLFHYADAPNDISIELSWEEIRPYICRYFDIVEESRREALYTTNPGCLYKVNYNCLFFTAIRNNVPISGQSNPVF